ncbi:MAG TPA: nucleotidyltransferase domain-containing protein [Longimicrobium sp.]
MLASSALAHLIMYFILHPDGEPHFRALQRATGIASRSLQHELARLDQLGMIQRERDGRLVRFQRVADHPRWSVFRDLVREFAEPKALLRTALSEVPGIDAAFIYGSFARGEMDEHSDIDVFALGEDLWEAGPELALAAGTSEAAILLGHEVNVTRYTREKLESRRLGGFLRSVLAGPKEWLVGSDAVLELVAGGAA